MRAGDTFTHANWLNSDHTPLRCKVTRVARGAVYYRPTYSDGTVGAPMMCDEGDMHKYAKAECRHTECPEGYMQWHAWAEKKSRTHRQIECPACGLYAVWVRK